MRLCVGQPYYGTFTTVKSSQYPSADPEFSQMGAGSRPGLNSVEADGNPGHGLVEHLQSAGRVYAMVRDRRTIFVRPHTNW
ncbi:hypothetical protein OG226_26085 [Streptomyces sp. NBC_01261]|uniref:hypothetical protein n=1 Tax=unclassified Streptomyces TaxID=2593676 RepID=UPI002E2B7955|nr:MULTISPECIES: hypothetical protein [unclassified Streptomyces]